MKFGNIQIYKIGVTTSFSSKSCLANKQFRTYVVNNIKKREKKATLKIVMRDYKTLITTY